MIFSLIGAVIGGVASLIGASRIAKGQRQQVKATKKIEKQREKQMNLDAHRRQVDLVREAMRASAFNRANAALGGTMFSSGFQGGQASIANQRAQGASDIEQSRQIGSRVFDLNRRYAAGQATEASGQAITSLGGGIANIVGSISSL